MKKIKKSVLYVIPGLNPIKKDGASNRCESFINCFADNGYDVTCLSLTIYKEYLSVLKQKSHLSVKAKWKILPHLYFLDRYIKNIYVLFEKIYVWFLTVINHYDYILADYATGADIVSLAKNKSIIIINHRGDLVDEHCLNHSCSMECPSVKTLLRLIKKSVSVADYSITVSSALKRNIEEYTGIELKRNFVFPCCADLDRFSDDHRRDSRFKDRIVLGYFGGLSKWQCVDELVDLAIALNKIDERYFLLVLTNSPISYIKPKLDLLGEQNYFVKAVGFADMPKWISYMDVSFALRENRPLNIVSSPTKLSESLATGVPVVVTRFSGDYNDIITDGKTGVVLDGLDFSSKDITKVHDFVCESIRDRERTRIICKQAVQDRTWRNFSSDFINFIEES